MFQALYRMITRWRCQRRNRHWLITLYRRYKQQYLDKGLQDIEIEKQLKRLHQQCANQDESLESVSPDSQSSSSFCSCQEAPNVNQSRFKTSLLDLSYELATTIGLALFILVFFRQMVFEHQMIPTGSMRPTFREMDHVFISKTAYGINNPIRSEPLSFDPLLLKRGQIVTLTSEHLPMIQKDSLYFGIFPGTKRFVKRMVATMNDRVWFYGGKLWILPKGSDQLVSSDTYLDRPHEYIPFHHFFGTMQMQGDELSSYHFFKQTHRFKRGAWNRWSGSVDPSEAILPWGMENYGMARLLTQRELHYSSASSKDIEPSEYYLEVTHHPTIYPTSLASRDSSSPFYVHRTLLPLSNEAIERLKRGLYTSRFVVKKQVARVYNYETPEQGAGIPLPLIEDGIFEFDSGLAYKVGEDGQRKLLPPSHPLYAPDLISCLYNAGISWNPKMLAQATSSPWIPFRYVYYDSGAIKSMGTTLLTSDDPLLITFIGRERDLHEQTQFYPPFLDQGVPTLSLVREKGLTLGPEEVMLLGDNHAGSGDSRDFGLVSYKDILGSPSCRFWPPSSLAEGIDATSRPWNRYDVLIAALFAVAWFCWSRYRHYQLERAFAWCRLRFPRSR